MSDSDESDFARDIAHASEDIGDIGDDDEEDIEETPPSSGGEQDKVELLIKVGDILGKTKDSVRQEVLLPTAIYTCLWQKVGLGIFGGDPRQKKVRERKNAVKPPQPDIVIQKVDTFAGTLQKKAPKTEPVAPSYPPGSLGNLLVAPWYQNTQTPEKHPLCPTYTLPYLPNTVKFCSGSRFDSDAVLAPSSWAERKSPAAGVVGSNPGRPRCCATGGGAIFLPEIRLRQVFLRISPYPQKNAFLRITLAGNAAFTVLAGQGAPS